jgi:hypothetical protein
LSPARELQVVMKRTKLLAIVAIVAIVAISMRRRKNRGQDTE